VTVIPVLLPIDFLVYRRCGSQHVPLDVALSLQLRNKSISCSLNKPIQPSASDGRTVEAEKKKRKKSQAFPLDFQHTVALPSPIVRKSCSSSKRLG
jgi:hypothetical protein